MQKKLKLLFKRLGEIILKVPKPMLIQPLKHPLGIQSRKKRLYSHVKEAKIAV